MKLLKLFQSIFTQPQEPSPSSVVNYEEGEQPSSGPMPLEEAFRVHAEALGTTGSGKTFDPSRWDYDPDNIEEVKEQIKHAAREFVEARKHWNAIFGECVATENAAQEINAKAYPKYLDCKMKILKEKLKEADNKLGEAHHCYSVLLDEHFINSTNEEMVAKLDEFLREGEQP